jgi:hypothetical protein
MVRSAPCAAHRVSAHCEITYASRRRGRFQGVHDDERLLDAAGLGFMFWPI